MSHGWPLRCDDNPNPCAAFSGLQPASDHLNTSTEAKPMKDTAPDKQSAEPLSTQQPSPPSPGHAMRAGGSLISSTKRYCLFSVAGVTRFCLRVKARANRQRGLIRRKDTESKDAARCCEKLRGAALCMQQQHVSTAQPSANTQQPLGRTHAHRKKTLLRAAGLRQTCWLVSDLGAAPLGCRSTSDGWIYSSRTEEAPNPVAR